LTPIRTLALASLLGTFGLAQVPEPQTPAPPPLPPSAMPPVLEAGSPEATVQRNIDAYNAHDANAVAATFAPDAQFIQHPGILVYDGRDAIYKGFVDIFRKNKKATCRSVHRTFLGRRIVDEQEYTGLAKEPIRGLVIYEVRNGLIANVWAIPSE
jgi:hypothetical protein